jgi:hypothetical protein
MIKFNPNIDLNYNAEIIYNDIVCLKTFELYCNIDANLKPLDGQYSAFVVDKCNEILDNITTHFLVQEQQNLTAFEFYLKKDYYKPVKLMVKNLVNGTIFYSNYFTCKQNNLTFRIDYKNSRNFNNFELYQSTRLSGYFTTLENESDVKTYIQENGKKVSNRAILTKYKNFVFDKIDNFIYDQLCEALANEIVYIDSERITDKPLLKVSEVQGSSNFFESNFKGAIDKKDIYTPTPQIFLQLQLFNYLPKGTYITGATIPIYKFIFNYNIEIISTEPILIFADGLLFQTLNNSDLTILNNEITALRTDIQNEKNFEIFIPGNKFKNELGMKNIEYTLFFNIQNADFLGTDFNNNDFLTD